METAERVMLTDAKAGELCGVSAKTVQRWRKFHGLPQVKIGITVRIPLDEFRAWVSKRSVGVK